MNDASSVLFVDARGRVLLVEPNYKPYWDLPGGRLEPGESPRDAAAREVKEELGLLVHVGRLLVVDFLPGLGYRFVFAEGPLLSSDSGFPPGHHGAAVVGLVHARQSARPPGACADPRPPCRGSHQGVRHRHNPLPRIRSGDQVSTKVYARVKVEPGTRLEALYAQYDELERAAKESDARFEALKNAIKAELANAAPNEPAISADCASAGLTLEMTYSETWRLDAKGMKAAEPATYVKWVRKSGSWTLRRGKA